MPQETLPPPVSLESFDFGQLEADLTEIDITEQAEMALSSILRPQDDDGNVRSYEQIKAETEAFFSNPVIVEVESRMNALASQYAHWCAAEGGGAAGVMNDGILQDVYSMGQEFQTHTENDGHGHGKIEPASPNDDDEYETDSFGRRTKKKARKTSRAILSWFGSK